MKPVYLLRWTVLGDVPFGRLAVGDKVCGKVVAVTDTPTGTTVVIREDTK